MSDSSASEYFLVLLEDYDQIFFAKFQLPNVIWFSFGTGKKKKMKTRYLKKEKKMEFRKDRDDFELTVNGKLVTLNREY